jgi:hypothetical protein
MPALDIAVNLAGDAMISILTKFLRNTYVLNENGEKMA